MSGQVSFESAHLREGLTADVAFKRPLARVDPHMFLQIAFGTECFITRLAHMFLLFLFCRRRRRRCRRRCRRRR